MPGNNSTAEMETQTASGFTVPPNAAPSRSAVDAAASQQTPRHLVSSLIKSIPLPEPATTQSANPLRDSSPEARNIFLTLYALFEKELLPALDLLDRGLVTRLKVRQPPGGTGSNNDAQHPHTGQDRTLLLVRSAQSQSHRSQNPAYTHTTHYEVRLLAWSCSCPAFTFAAFPANALSPSSGAVGDCFVGGLTRGQNMPVCKHLLACSLVENCDMFKDFVAETEVSLEELAGWSAGWGD